MEVRSDGGCFAGAVRVAYDRVVLVTVSVTISIWCFGHIDIGGVGANRSFILGCIFSLAFGRFE
jgi:hypothetical protein